MTTIISVLNDTLKELGNQISQREKGAAARGKDDDETDTLELAPNQILSNRIKKLGNRIYRLEETGTCSPFRAQRDLEINEINTAEEDDENTNSTQYPIQYLHEIIGELFNKVDDIPIPEVTHIITYKVGTIDIGDYGKFDIKAPSSPKKYFRLDLSYYFLGESNLSYVNTEWQECQTYSISITTFRKDLTGDMTVTIYLNDESDGSGSTTLKYTKKFSALSNNTINVWDNEWEEEKTGK